ncbi:glycosyltransferase family 2 protein [Flavobacterium haoranii]|uniref:Glycosyl transferase family 2 n=1 Tax=Flavobacterium haoranii TaxID=683124 RepID=A0A1M6JSG3_9FLAO|nr:glycosyltransferase family 2 protein [Flavobacterium haoranii]SHJ49631.1 Glycosyl transferase family 2 [Flavobacterium haoranii]
MPKISIVIPLYNKGSIVRKTLESVINQTFSDFEIIIANDGSTDDSVAIVESFKDKRILLFHQENKGAAAARNFGIEKASGELIAFLDADDIWKNNHLEEIFQLYNDFPCCGMYCSRYAMKISNNKIIPIDYLPELKNDFRGVIPDYFRASLHYRVGLTSAVSIPKSILEKYNFNTEVSSGQDTELFTKIAIHFPVAITDKVTMQYDFSTNNHLSKTPITKKKLFDFSQFAKFESKNPSLKSFLDLYRIEYALNFRVLGAIKKSNAYLKDVTTEIPFKTRLLLKLPPFILRSLLKLKHWLRSKGIDFTVYH